MEKLIDSVKDYKKIWLDIDSLIRKIF
jgi:hypothetical protein